MDNLINHMNVLKIDSQDWKSKLDHDLKQLAVHYAQDFYESICFVPFENIDSITVNKLVDYLESNNNARHLLVERIKQLYPDEKLIYNDIDSVMDYYINSLKLII